MDSTNISLHLLENIKKESEEMDQKLSDDPPPSALPHVMSTTEPEQSADFENVKLKVESSPDVEIWNDERQRSVEAQQLNCRIVSVKEEKDLLYRSPDCRSIVREDSDYLINVKQEPEQSADVESAKLKVKSSPDDVIWNDKRQRYLEAQQLHCQIVSVKEEKGLLYPSPSDCRSIVQEDPDFLINIKKEPGGSGSLKHKRNLDSSTFGQHTIHTKPGVDYESGICLKKREGSLENDNMHMNSHSNEWTYKCEICSESFLKKESLRAHKRIHADAPTYKCRSGSLKHKCNLDSATFGQHTSHAKPGVDYESGLCLKKFEGTLENENMHTNSHSNEWTYKCEMCSESFLRKGSLRAHKRIHVDVQPYKCKTCSKSFKNKSYFNLHHGIHSGLEPYKCETCLKAFESKRSLALHERIHSSVKTYRCKTCSKSFKSMWYFNLHEGWAHSGVTPYKCKTCQRGFRYKIALDYHERLH